jgi:uncharacterized protein (TIGR03437 family)
MGFQFRALLLLTLSCAGFMHAQPSNPIINGVVNSASFAANGSPGGDLPQGSLVVIFGENLGPAEIAFSPGVPLSQNLSNTTVQIDTNNQQLRANLIYTSATQVAMILPSATPVGGGTITLTYEGRRSAAFPTRFVASSPGLFTQNQAGSGAGIAYNFAPAGETLNGPANPAVPEQIVILWGTGLGPVLSDERIPRAQALDIPLEVLVGGRRANILYKGRSGCCVGIDQINIQVPAGVTGCRVPVSLNVGGVVSNYATLSIVERADQTCSDPAGLTAAEIQQTKTSNQFRYGVLNVTRQIVPAPAGNVFTRTDSAVGVFGQVNAAGLGLVGSPLDIAPGSCIVYNYTGENVMPTLLAPPSPLNLGIVAINNELRGQKTLIRDAGLYAATLDVTSINNNLVPQGYLDPGTFTLQVEGGSAVERFTRTFATEAGLQWPAQEANQQFARAQNLTVGWANGRTNQYALIQGGAQVDRGNEISNVPGVAFACLERAEVGRFTIPASVLTSIPSTVASNGTRRPSGFLSVGFRQLLPISGALPSGLNSIKTVYTERTQRPVFWQ